MKTNVNPISDISKYGDIQSFRIDPSNAFLYYKSLQAFQRNYDYKNPIGDINFDVAMMVDMMSYFLAFHMEYLESEKDVSKDYQRVIIKPSEAIIYYTTLQTFQKNYDYENPIYDVNFDIVMMEDLRSYFLALHLEYLKSEAEKKAIVNYQ